MNKYELDIIIKAYKQVQEFRNRGQTTFILDEQEYSKHYLMLIYTMLTNEININFRTLKDDLGNIIQLRVN
jgi:hypothetical protein